MARQGDRTRRRLCMIVHARYPIGEPRVQRQAAAALAEGWEVDVVCLQHGDEPAYEVVEGIRIYRLPVSHIRTAGVARMALEYLRFVTLTTLAVARLDRQRRYRIVHVSNPPDLLVLAALLPRLLGARLILDVHDLTPDLFEWRFASSRLRPFVTRLLVLQERMSCRLATDLMTVHDSCADVLRSRSAASRKEIVIVMNTLDERLLPASVPERSPWTEPAQLVYHGSLTQLYGVHTLVDAVARLDVPNRVRLTILGDGDELPRLRAQVEALELGGIVEFTGVFAPIAETLERVAQCDVGVVPLIGLPVNRFSLPTKLFEYVALGLPVVCSRTTAIARHFAETELAYAIPGDADDLARALKAVLDDPLVALAQAERARKRYEEYRWPISRDRLLALLDAPASERSAY